MGGVASRLGAGLGLRANPKPIIMLGLDAAGKTTILYRLKLGPITTTVPAIGMNIETLSYKSIEILSWDVGGGGRIRPLFRYFYQNANALIFVIDANDRDRIHEAAEELRRALEEPLLAGIPLLVFANKADLPNAMQLTDILMHLQLPDINAPDDNGNAPPQPRKWFLVSSAATSLDKQGIYDGFEWLSNVLTGKDSDILV